LVQNFPRGFIKINYQNEISEVVPVIAVFRCCHWGLGSALKSVSVLVNDCAEADCISVVDDVVIPREMPMRTANTTAIASAFNVILVLCTLSF
jgi:hypothetical protein